MESAVPKGGGCITGCQQCKKASADPGALSGWRLVVSALSAMLLPLVTAVAGACVWPRETALVGALVGFGVGVIIGLPLSRRIGRKVETIKEAS
jgi:hypothetical protein